MPRRGQPSPASRTCSPTTSAGAGPAAAGAGRGPVRAGQPRFWIDERGGFYAIGLDGDKRQIDSMISNMGQLLWSGLVPRERAAIVAGRLMSEQMFSDWGIRTTSTAERSYNP